MYGEREIIEAVDKFWSARRCGGQTTVGSGVRKLHTLPDLPINKDNGLALLEERTALRELREIILSDAAQLVIDEILMEHNRGESILIATTNYESLLDKAVWRRFDEVVRFEMPSEEQIKRLLSIKLSGVRRNFEADDAQVASLFSGMSHADIERVLRRAVKEMILSGLYLASYPTTLVPLVQNSGRSFRRQGGTMPILTRPRLAASMTVSC